MSAPPRRAALIATGDELIGGEQVDLNSSWLATRLAELGWSVERAVLIGDDEEEIAETMRALATRAALVISTGGLGPTLDDVSRHAAARAAGVELVLDAKVVARIYGWFAERGRVAAPANERQALRPAGAIWMPNSAGTAPGFLVQVGEAWLAVLPGPPREVQQVFEEQLAPFLSTLPAPGEVVHRRFFYLFGLSESVFAEQVGEWMDRRANPRIGVRASGGVLKVKLEGRADDAAAAEAITAVRAAEFAERFRRWIFSQDEPDPAAALGALLIERKATFACAESCTGGLVASRLIDVPGVSEVFLEGFVTYSNESKCARLGVDPALIEAHGAVSEEVAAAMAAGVAEGTGARLTLSTTGIAGPTGGTPEKPVGLVHVATCLDGEVRTTEHRFLARGRGFVRNWAANTACDLARRRLLEADS